MAVTWNPSDKAPNITLSLGNLKAANVGTGYSGVRSTASNSVGKYYWEVVPNGVGASDVTSVCVVNGSILLTGNSFGAVSADGISYQSNGNVGYNSSTVATYASFTVNDRISVALDVDNQKIWFRKNGGIWNGSGANNPATNTGGISIAAMGTPLYAAVEGFDNGDALTASFAQPFVYVIPSGFAPFDDSIPITGVTATGAAGTLAISNTLAALSGAVGTGGVGAASSGVGGAVSGVSATGAVGTVTVVNGLPSAFGTGQVGTVIPVLNPSFTGAFATGAAGMLTGTPGITLTGVRGTGNVGAVYPIPPAPRHRPALYIPPHDDYPASIWDGT